MSTVFLNPAETSYTVECMADARFVFGFASDSPEFSRAGDHLVLTFENGASITLANFYSLYPAQGMPLFEVDGAEVSGKDFLAALDQPELMPAAGHTPANNSHYQEWSNMELLGGLDRLGGLDVGWQDGDNLPETMGGAGGDDGVAEAGGIVVSPLNLSLAVSDGGTENDVREVVFTVSLDRTCETDITVSLTNGLTLTVPAGQLEGSASLATRPDDVFTQQDDIYEASIENAVGGTVEDELVWTDSSVSASVTDDSDVTKFSISTENVSEADGGSVTFVIQADHAPQGNASVQVTIGTKVHDVELDASGKGTLTIEHGNNEDFYLDESSITAEITGVTGGNYEAVDFEGATATATIEDTIDATKFTLSASPADANGNVIFTVKAENLPHHEDTNITVRV
ncbi:MAG: hypothetical protein IJZ18_02885, partial [Mailhella sp.]|nr:hypothetical protein [Mailhella sp.]